MDGRQKMYKDINSAIRVVWESSNYIEVREFLKEDPKLTKSSQLRHSIGVVREFAISYGFEVGDDFITTLDQISKRQKT